MGEAVDYFTPKDKTVSLCEMLTSHDKHFWSSDLYSGWREPKYSDTGLGGSATGWLINRNLTTDNRTTLPFWGVDTTLTVAAAATTKQLGGCCHTDMKEASPTWGKGFTMEYCGVPQLLAPLCKPFAAVPASLSANKAFWESQCSDIPQTAAYVKVAMGDIVDYFKPTTGTLYCDMLSKGADHMWSEDPLNVDAWQTPKSYDAAKGLGGNGADGLKPSDGRTSVSFWGSDTASSLGGCCYSKTDDAAAFGKSFSMSYCEIPQAPSLQTLIAELKEDETSVGDMEKTIHTEHVNMSAAEHVAVEASGNVSIARKGIFSLAAKAKDEAEKLKGLQMEASLLNSSLSNDQISLYGAKKRVEKDAEKVKATADIAAQSANDAALQKQEELNTKIWNLMDPTNKDSLDATEKSVRSLEKGAAKFRGELAEQIKTVMVTKLRRGVNKLRKAMMSLGSVVHARSSRTFGEVEDSDTSLGSELGLADS